MIFEANESGLNFNYRMCQLDANCYYIPIDELNFITADENDFVEMYIYLKENDINSGIHPCIGNNQFLKKHFVEYTQNCSNKNYEEKSIYGEAF